MSLLDNIDQVSFASSLTIDKIVGEGSYTASTASGFNATVAHGFDYPVIANGRWSIDGINYLPCGVEISDGPLVGGFPSLADCLIWTNANNVHIWTSHGFPTDQTFIIEWQLETIT